MWSRRRAEPCSLLERAPLGILRKGGGGQLADFVSFLARFEDSGLRQPAVRGQWSSHLPGRWVRAPNRKSAAVEPPLLDRDTARRTPGKPGEDGFLLSARQSLSKPRQHRRR